MGEADRLWVGHGVERAIAVDADAVFRALTDIRALPTWNRSMLEVAEAPDSSAAGSAWTAQMCLGGERSTGRAAIVLHDPRARRWSYHSTVDGGDGSYTDWRWHVEGDESGCVVRAGFVVRAANAHDRSSNSTRRHDRMSREVEDSLAALEAVASAAVATPTRSRLDPEIALRLTTIDEPTGARSLAV
jgi:hypothetical protein